MASAAHGTALSSLFCISLLSDWPPLSLSSHSTLCTALHYTSSSLLISGIDNSRRVPLHFPPNMSGAINHPSASAGRKDASARKHLNQVQVRRKGEDSLTAVPNSIPSSFSSTKEILFSPSVLSQRMGGEVN